MSGKLIVIDGLDGSGKATQSKILCDELNKAGIKARHISFPNYGKKGCTLVEMYLNGELSDDPSDINGYASSVFFAADRYTSYITEWKKDYEDSTVIVLDRYTTSNAVHQMSKLDRSEWESFMDWLFDFEYNKIAIPKPDAVIYLDMDIEISQKLLSERYGGDENKKDIHEKSLSYIKACRPAAMFAARKLGWKVIECFSCEEVLSIDVISQKIKETVRSDKLRTASKYNGVESIFSLELN